MKNKNPFRPETSYHHRLSSLKKVYMIHLGKDRYGRRREPALDCLVLHLNSEWSLWEVHVTGREGLIWKHGGRLVELTKAMTGDIEDT